MSVIQLIAACLVASSPCLYLLAFAASLAPVRWRLSGWPITIGFAGCVLFASLGALLIVLVGQPSSPIIATWPSLLPAAITPSIRVDVLTLAMLALIGFIGFVLLIFSRQYLVADPGCDDAEQRYYRRWFTATLAAVTTLVVSNQLIMLGLGWVATSLCLHQLLTYYDQRPQAVLAAHKKFLSSRLADVFLLTGFVLIGVHFDSLQMNEIFAAVDASDWSPGLTVATALIACAAILKCALLPFHGWLIQVMEAPTPVSALLHAGVVNIGGFLMIRFAPLMAPATLAQTLLIIAGTTTAVVAGLIMSTRISIKVMLAWSTCAQMGFMLLECGLGLYGLALLHLLAHSLYKAHSFLSAGDAASLSARREQTPTGHGAGVPGWLLVSLIAVLAATLALLFPHLFHLHPAISVVVIGALATLGGDAMGLDRKLGVRALAGGVAVVGLYALWTIVFSSLVPSHPPANVRVAAIGVALAFAGLFMLRAMLATRGGARRLYWLHPHVYGGFYLDQLFTRVTMIIWPPKLPPHAASVSHGLHAESKMEAPQ